MYRTDVISLAVQVIHILDLSFCGLGVRLSSVIWSKACNLSQLVHAGVMCTLVIIQFVINSVKMYRDTKQWRLGPFINLLVMQGMAYFFVILMWSLLNTLDDFEIFSPVGPQQILPLNLAQYVLISTLTPRFILNMRELYACTTYAGRGHGIDTGFGLTALSTHGSRSLIVFADGGDGEGLDDSEGIPMQTRTA